MGGIRHFLNSINGDLYFKHRCFVRADKSFNTKRMYEEFEILLMLVAYVVMVTIKVINIIT